MILIFVVTAAVLALAQADGDCTGLAETLTWECGGVCEEYIPCLVYNASDCEASSGEHSASCTNDNDSVCAYTCFTNFYADGQASLLVRFGDSSSSSSRRAVSESQLSGKAWVYEDSLGHIGLPNINPVISIVSFVGGSEDYATSYNLGVPATVTLVDGFRIANDTVMDVELSYVDLSQVVDLLTLFPVGLSGLRAVGSGLTTFEAGEGQGLNLTTISLDYNSLIAFSGSFPALVSMGVNDNSLTAFSGDYPVLDTLSLQGNSLSTFSGSFPALTSLYLSANTVTNFSIEIPTLSVLGLGSNLLTSFSGDFPVLSSLSLSSNLLTNFSGEYPTLSSLYLDNNSLANFTGDFPALLSLNLTNNLLATVPDAVFNISTLTQLYLSGNPFAGMPTFTREQVTFLQTLDGVDLQAADFAEAIDCGNAATASVGTFEVCVSDEVTETSSSVTTGSSGLSRGAIAGIATGVVVVVVVVVVGFLVWQRRSRSFGKGGANNQDLLTADLAHGLEAGGLWNDERLKALRIDAGDIEDVRKIGSGAFGEVWLVRYQSTKLLASKRLLEKHEGGKKRQEKPKKSTGTGSLQLFVEEIKLVSTLEHTNIVACVGVAWTFHSDIQALFEYVENGDLRDYLIKNKPNSELYGEDERQSAEAFKLQIACDIVDALVYVHSFAPPVVHRDLKSRNVLLTSDWRAKVTDFGSARVQSENGTMTAGVGTGRWLAPEVLRGSKDYGAPADIFAFGVMLSELDTHRIPYDDTRSPDGQRPLANVAILQLVAEGKLRPTFSEVCRPATKELAVRCMAQIPEERPVAALVAYELRKVLKDVKSSAV